MKEPSYALQQSVYNALAGSTDLVAKIGTVKVNNVNVGKVFHRVPAGTPLPYVLLGRDQIIDAAEDGGTMFECIVTVYAYAAAIPQLKLIVSDIYAALNQWLTFDGFKMYELHYEGTQCRTEDGEVEQAIVEFRYNIEAISS